MVEWRFDQGTVCQSNVVAQSRWLRNVQGMYLQTTEQSTLVD